MPAMNGAASGRNPPRATRMAVIAFINRNIVLGCIWGSFSVLLGAAEHRLHVGRDLSTLAVPAISLASALFAPVIGTLAVRYSLRLIMLAGAVLVVAGYALLAFSGSYVLYLVAYGLFLGPALAVADILPATLVTRWFTVHRGRALGLVCTPVMSVIMPLVSNWVLNAFGLTIAYGMLGGISALCIVTGLFIIDRPPLAHRAPAGMPHAEGGVTRGEVGRLLASLRFWALTLAFISGVAATVILLAHMVPMARSWGFSATLAATLLSILALAGVPGTIAFGWIADRLGGALALAILLLDFAVLWLLLLLHPPFLAVAVIIGLIGMHSASTVPVLAVALAENFGPESFSWAYGVVNLINLPFAVLVLPAAAFLFTRTGSYDSVLAGGAGFLALGSILSFTAMGRRASAGAHEQLAVNAE